MDKLKELIENWGFKEGVKDYWYKFITPDSSVSFEFREYTVTITFKMLCGTRNEELIPIGTGTIISKDMIEHSSVIGAYIKDTIICQFVLNVVDEKEQNTIIEQIKHLLNKNGKAFFTVRIGLKQCGYKFDKRFQKYSLQRFVILPFKIINSAPRYRFVIYEMTN